MEQNEEIINLAKEIIGDAELKRIQVASLVSKASRLASLVNDTTLKEWLNYEKYGYSDSKESIAYMERTGRTYDETTKIGLGGSISTQEDAIEGSLAELDVVKNFKPGGTYSTLQFQNQLQQVKTLNRSISTYKRIC